MQKKKYDVKAHGRYVGLCNGKSTTVRRLAKRIRATKGLRAAISFLAKTKAKTKAKAPKKKITSSGRRAAPALP
jgi:hypothetical protein